MSRATRRVCALLAVSVGCFTLIKEKYAPITPIYKCANKGHSIAVNALFNWDLDNSDKNTRIPKKLTDIIGKWEISIMEKDWFRKDSMLSSWTLAAIAAFIVADLQEIYSKPGTKKNQVLKDIEDATLKVQNIIDRNGTKFSEYDKANEAVKTLYKLLEEFE